MGGTLTCVWRALVLETIDVHFLFATGIENSAPTIKEAGSGSTKWRNAASTSDGGPTSNSSRIWGFASSTTAPNSQEWLGDGHYDWTFADETFADLKAKDILPIVDLCHFGVPDWVGNFRTRTFRGYSNATLTTAQPAFRGSSSIRRSMRCSSAPPFPPAGDGGTSN